MKEIYRDVVGFEGKYKVSNFGNVLSLNYQNTGKPKVLVPKKHHTGYLTVLLNSKHNKSIHVLVAEAFLPNPHHKKCVNHIDGNKHNNCLSNLEWTTHKENTAHAIRIGLRDPHFNNAKRGKENAKSKPIYQFSLDGEFMKKWDCISDAAREIGCSPCQIISVACGRTKTCHGFLWRYSISKDAAAAVPFEQRCYTAPA